MTMQPSSQIRRTLMLAVLAAVVAGGWALSASAEDADAHARLVDYYRRKQNLAPNITVTVTNVRDSELKGLKQATLEASSGQKQDVLMSEDGRWVVFAQPEDVTANPFAEVMKKVTVTGKPVRGPKDAKVTIVEFSDFQCPYCARAHQTVAQVMKDYGDKVRLVYKHFPLGFHPWAEPAAIAAACAFEQKEAAFWVLYDYFFDHQSELNAANLKDKALEALKDAKIDQAKLTACIDAKKPLDAVKKDMAEGGQVGVSGTPAFLINGRSLVGAQPVEKFKAVIDDELQRAAK